MSLLEYIQNQDSDKILAFLRYPVNFVNYVPQTDEDGRTALMLIIINFNDLLYYYRESISDLLLPLVSKEFGLKDNFDYYAIMYAAECNHPDILKLLMPFEFNFLNITRLSFVLEIDSETFQRYYKVILILLEANVKYKLNYNSVLTELLNHRYIKYYTPPLIKELFASVHKIYSNL